MKNQLVLKKMMTELADPIRYELKNSEKNIELNSFIGKRLQLRFTGKIICLNCQKTIKKSYSQGYCFPCSLKLAECDMCILKPETCHYDKGTCREPKWGEEHCLKPHYVYLANSSGLKVGITRRTQVPYRWIDQGASAALPVVEVKNRLISGKVEVLLKNHVADKTDWRKMLKGEPEKVDLLMKKKELIEKIRDELVHLEANILDLPIQYLSYPVKEYPQKITSLNLEKTPQIDSILLGIKGQYLIFVDGVFNVRNHTGYEVEISGE